MDFPVEHQKVVKDLVSKFHKKVQGFGVNKEELESEFNLVYALKIEKFRQNSNIINREGHLYNFLKPNCEWRIADIVNAFTKEKQLRKTCFTAENAHYDIPPKIKKREK